jgi:hypothetical protein
MQATFSEISLVKKFGFSELTPSQYLTIASFSRSNSCCPVLFLRETVGGIFTVQQNYKTNLARYKFKLSNVTIGDNFRSQCSKRDL